MAQKPAVETVEPVVEPVEPKVEPVEPDVEPETVEDEGKTFDLPYVQKLRDENAKYRQRAGQADEMAQRLHSALVEASGRLADPTDLPYDQSHLETPEALTEAIEALLSKKPHLASRRPQGDIQQGAGETPGGASLAGILRQNAGG